MDEEKASGIRESVDEWYEAEENTSLARSSSLSSFFDTQPEDGQVEMAAGARELPALRRSFSTDDALALLTTGSTPGTASQATRRRQQNGGRPARRQLRLLAQLPWEEQRLLLVLHIMLLLPPEKEGDKPQKTQQACHTGTPKGGCSPKQLRQQAKRGKRHEARAQSQICGTLRMGCKNY